jgi:hypothetical protein
VRLDAREPRRYGEQHRLDDAAEDPAARLARALAGWPADITDLALADGIARARWPLATADHPPTAEAAHARELVERLCELVAALAPGMGPYR